ncbi:DUF5667 domain-containing protein [Nocardioides dubius]|uniref:DUF5667 domain-containing protein n=1 Tax=Nocardioides dubius TaxID=317019 RepID=A0ABP4ELR6_9ACTN
MISLTPAARRAEEFAAQLEGRSSRTPARDADLLELVGTLRAMPAPAPRPEFVSALRAELMAEAEVALSETSRKLALPASSSPRKRDRKVAVAAGAIALIGVTSSMAVASQSALPGDALYPIKRALEGATTTLQVNDGAKADQLLDNANSRLSEVKRLSARSDRSAQVPATLREFNEQSDSAADLLIEEFEKTGDKKNVEKLRNFAAASIEELTELGRRLPASVSDSLTEAVGNLVRIDDLAAQVCPDCSGSLPDLPEPVTDGFSDDIAKLLGRLGDPSKVSVEDPREAAAPEGSEEPTAPTTQAPPTEPSTTPGTGEEKPKNEKPKGIGDVLVGNEGLLGPEGPIIGGVVDPLLGGLLGGLLGAPDKDADK